MPSADQKFDIFSADELKTIQKVVSKIQTHAHTGGRGILCNGFDDQQLIYPAIKKLVIDRINQHFATKISKMSLGQCIICPVPLGIHNDLPYGELADDFDSHTFLIPLSISYADGLVRKVPATTIIFNQEWTEAGDMDKYISTNPVKPLPADNAKNIWNQYMAPWPKEYAEYLSVKLIAEWTLGSVIRWDQILMHSSSNFTSHGIIEKTGLVLFCKK
jgi:hypothetical protein